MWFSNNNKVVIRLTDRMVCEGCFIMFIVIYSMADGMTCFMSCMRNNDFSVTKSDRVTIQKKQGLYGYLAVRRRHFSLGRDFDILMYLGYLSNNCTIFSIKIHIVFFIQTCQFFPDLENLCGEMKNINHLRVTTVCLITLWHVFCRFNLDIMFKWSREGD